MQTYQVEWFKNSKNGEESCVVKSELSEQQAKDLKTNLDNNWDLSIIQSLSFRVKEGV
jgi:hypothetical protein